MSTCSSKTSTPLVMLSADELSRLQALSRTFRVLVPSSRRTLNLHLAITIPHPADELCRGLRELEGHDGSFHCLDDGSHDGSASFFLRDDSFQRVFGSNSRRDATVEDVDTSISVLDEQ